MIEAIVRRLVPRTRDGTAAWRKLAGAAGGAGAIAVMVGLPEWPGISLAAVLFTTSIVLAMAAPDSASAQPRSILLGHVLSTLSGFAVLWLFGSSSWLASLAAGIAILFMQITDSLHPPPESTLFWS